MGVLERRRVRSLIWLDVVFLGCASDTEPSGSPEAKRLQEAMACPFGVGFKLLGTTRSALQSQRG